MRLPSQVKMVEVGARDGLQNEATAVPVATRIELIDRLTESGLPVIEAGSFVSTKWVPQMADSAAVMVGIARRPGVGYPVLTPNMMGFEAAIAAGAEEVSVFAAASETFSQRNINCSVAQSLERFAPVLEAAREKGVRVRGYVSCVLGCPYEGDVAPDTVADIAGRLLRMGCHEISLGDTIGVGTPSRAQALVERVSVAVPIDRLAVHFHDTYGQALVNILAVLQRGIAVVDGSVAGLGGCPYAAGAAGNVASEDVLFMLDGLGIESGVTLDTLAAAGWFICKALGRQPASRVSLALAAKGASAAEEAGGQ